MLAQTTLRNILGTRTLSGILSEREEIAEEMLKILDEATDPWGEYLSQILIPLSFKCHVSSFNNFHMFT